MIQVNKPLSAPEILAKGRLKKCKFNRNIYSHETVKNALKKAQHEKCCYCEGIFIAFASGDVEHYRPKGAVKQGARSQRITPGYFWLAYSWENLYWSCQVCNRNKKDLFPLGNPAERARSQTDDLAKEKPLILDPGGPEDPQKHISFRAELAIGKTERGKETILVIGLNRGELTEARRTCLQRLKMLLTIVEYCPDFKIIGDSIIELTQAVTPMAAFSAMATKLLSSHHLVHKLKQ